MIEKTFITDDDPVARKLQDEEDEKTKEAKKKYGNKENKHTSFHEDFLCDKSNNGHN